MSLCSLSYLGGVLDRASAISCGSDAVTDPVTGRIITPLPQDIVQVLTSPHLNCNHSICRRFVVTIPFCCFVSISTLGNAVYSLHLRAYCCVKEGYQSSSASAVTINSLEVAEYPLFLGGGCYRFHHCCYHPFFALYFHPWKCGLLSGFMRVLLCPLGKRVTNPHLLWQSL